MSGQAPRTYHTPTLTYLGSLTDLTLGHGGSSFDGQGLVNQKGYGNDDNPSSVGGYDINVGKSQGNGHHYH